jgi:hypothetical protein
MLMQVSMFFIPSCLKKSRLFLSTKTMFCFCTCFFYFNKLNLFDLKPQLNVCCYFYYLPSNALNTRDLCSYPHFNHDNRTYNYGV